MQTNTIRAHIKRIKFQCFVATIMRNRCGFDCRLSRALIYRGQIHGTSSSHLITLYAVIFVIDVGIWHRTSHAAVAASKFIQLRPQFYKYIFKPITFDLFSYFRCFTFSFLHFLLSPLFLVSCVNCLACFFFLVLSSLL